MKNKQLYNLFIKGLGAGVLLTLAGAAAVILGSIVTNPTLALVIRSIVFPIGLIAIFYCNCALYTSGVATLGDNRWDFTNSYLFKLIIIWLGNLVGSILTSIFIFAGVGTKFAALFAAIAATKCSTDICILILLSIACNFLICLGVQCAQKTTNQFAQILILFFCVFLFMIFGFEHSVANMGFFSLAAIMGAETRIVEMIFYNLLPVTIGNFIGGKWSAFFNYRIGHTS